MTTPPDIEALVADLDNGALFYGNRGNASPASLVGDLMAAAGNAIRSLSSERDRLKGALEKVGAIRPVDWDDDEDAEQAAAWEALDEALSTIKEGGVDGQSSSPPDRPVD